MYRNLIKNTTIALGTLLVGSSLVFAAGLQGNVTALDGKGMGTIHTSDGKDHQVKVGQDFKVGSKVDCDMKNNAMECRLASPQASTAPTAPTQAQAPAAVKASPTPAASTPATSPTTPAPASK